MFRGYDTSALFREDVILRIRQLEAEIAAIQKEMEEIEREQEIRRPKWWWIHIDEEGRTKMITGKR